VGIEGAGSSPVAMQLRLHARPFARESGATIVQLLAIQHYCGVVNWNPMFNLIKRLPRRHRGLMFGMITVVLF
jgi:vancomycin permeability regulator SanA